MRNFADLVRIPFPQKKQVDLVHLLQRVTDLLHLKAAEKNVEIKFEHTGSAFMIMADIQQMEQVLINIIKNALEAIDGQGTITILTCSYPKQLIIRDSGKGISPNAEEHLFSPFYSTKKDGQGVGLAIIKEILINHGFNFTLKTLSKGKTEFMVQF
jgi:signal transduction histidine kinase